EHRERASCPFEEPEPLPEGEHPCLGPGQSHEHRFHRTALGKTAHEQPVSLRSVSLSPVRLVRYHQGELRRSSRIERIEADQPDGPTVAPYGVGTGKPLPHPPPQAKAVGEGG